MRASFCWMEARRPTPIGVGGHRVELAYRRKGNRRAQALPTKARPWKRAHEGVRTKNTASRAVVRLLQFGTPIPPAVVSAEKSV